jgi:DNA-directed RNA polymerase specialized sigma subunit
MASGKPKDEIIYMVDYKYDFTMKEIGDFLGVHDSPVSRAVKKHESTKKNEKQKEFERDNGHND